MAILSSAPDGSFLSLSPATVLSRSRRCHPRIGRASSRVPNYVGVPIRLVGSTIFDGPILLNAVLLNITKCLSSQPHVELYPVYFPLFHAASDFELVSNQEPNFRGWHMVMNIRIGPGLTTNTA